MTVLDWIVLLVIGSAAVTGFLRGFVQEVLSLLAWLLAIVAVRFFHAPVTEILAGQVGGETSGAVVALVILFLVTYLGGKWAARSVGARTRRSLLGPVDRVLGFGFGGLKGLLIVTLAFFLLLLVSDTITAGVRPEWIREARSYPLLAGSADAMSDMVEARREGAREPDADPQAAPGSAPR